MLFGKTKLEFKVGVFVFIGLIILVVFVLSIGGFKTWTSGYYVKFKFDFINGVKIGAPVRFAGVDVGQVKRIEFRYNLSGKPEVEIIGWVKKDVLIPVDSTVWINTLGLLGEKYVEIMPGKNNEKFVLPEQVIDGNNPIAMHELSELARKIIGEVESLILKIKNNEGTIGKLFSEDAIYNELEALVLDLKRHPWKLFWKTK